MNFQYDEPLLLLNDLRTRIAKIQGIDESELLHFFRQKDSSQFYGERSASSFFLSQTLVCMLVKLYLHLRVSQTPSIVFVIQF